MPPCRPSHLRLCGPQCTCTSLHPQMSSCQKRVKRRPGLLAWSLSQLRRVTDGQSDRPLSSKSGCQPRVWSYSEALYCFRGRLFDWPGPPGKGLGWLCEMLLINICHFYYRVMDQSTVLSEAPPILKQNWQIKSRHQNIGKRLMRVIDHSSMMTSHHEKA